MFENEEEKLHDIRIQIEQQGIPNSRLDGAIHQGMERAKREQRLKQKNRKKGIWTLAISAVLLITLVTSIRVSPAFANAVSSIPGLEKIVAMIQYDKGLTAAIENDYFIPLGISQTRGGLTVTIDGYIVDQTGIVVFHTFHSRDELGNFGDMYIDMDVEGTKRGTSVFGYPHDENAKTYESYSNFSFEEVSNVENKQANMNIKFSHQGKDKVFNFNWSLPSSLLQGEVYELNQSVQVEGQEMTFEKAIIHPIRTEIFITFNKNNEMEILNFEDMHLVNEKGEEWSKIMNGLVSKKTSENKRSYFFESNFFEKPEKLFIKFSKIQALPKNESDLVINLDTKEIIQHPLGYDLRLIESSRKGLELHLYEKNFNYGLFSKVIDANGESINLESSGFSSREEFTYHDVIFENHSKTPIVHLPLVFFPNYINGDVSIKLK